MQHMPKPNFENLPPAVVQIAKKFELLVTFMREQQLDREGGALPLTSVTHARVESRFTNSENLLR